MTVLKPPTSVNPNTPFGDGRVFYNVVDDFDARGDGTTDDTSAIQTAINAAAAAGGGTVFCPEGTYRVNFGSSSITITGYGSLKYALYLKSNVHLLGAGAGVSILQCPAGPYDNTGRGFLMNESGGRSSNFSIKHLTFDGNSATTGVTGTDREYQHVGIFLGPCTDFEIAHCESKRWQGKDIHLVGEFGGTGLAMKRFWIHHNHIHDSNSNAIGYSQAGDEGMSDFWITDNVIENNQRGILGGEANQGAESIIAGTTTDARRWTIARNKIKNWGTISVVGTDGVCSDNYVDSHAGSPGLAIGMGLCTRVRITGNTIDATNNTTLPAIRCADSGSNEVLIAGNTILRPAVGTDATSAITFSGHLAERHTNLVIKDNIIKGGNALIGDIQVSEADGVDVSGNVCTSPADSTANNPGILVTTTCTEAVVGGNRLKNKYLDVQAPGAVVSGNRIEGPNTNSQALRVRGGKSAITGNRVKSYQTGGGSVGAVFIDATFNTFTGNTVENVNASKKWIQEGSTADSNLYAANNFIDSGTGTVTTVGANSKFRNNVGYITANYGAASKQNGNTIAHGLSADPTYIEVTSSVAKHIVSVTTFTSTTFTIALYDDTGTAIVANETVYWRAEA